MDETMWVRTDVVLPPEGQEVLIWTDMIHIARCSERGRRCAGVSCQTRLRPAYLW